MAVIGALMTLIGALCPFVTAMTTRLRFRDAGRTDGEGSGSRPALPAETGDDTAGPGMPVASHSFPSTQWQARRDGDGFERGVGLRPINCVRQRICCRKGSGH